MHDPSRHRLRQQDGVPFFSTGPRTPRVTAASAAAAAATVTANEEEEEEEKTLDRYGLW